MKHAHVTTDGGTTGRPGPAAGVGHLVGSQRVLIVEDDAVTRGALFALFVHEGWDVVVTRTLAGGMALLAPPPDCVVLDLTLPDGDGEAILREIRRRNLPTCVVICTGTEEPERIDALECLAPQAVLTKPIRFEDILEAYRLNGR